jgi:hypothetical protein
MTTDTMMGTEHPPANEGRVSAGDERVDGTDIDSDEALQVEEGRDELEKITNFVLTLTD